MSGNEFNGFDLMQWPVLLGILLAGFVLGLLFFGSLWLSTSRILHSQHPVTWIFGGFVLRMALLLSALYWLTDARWEKLLVCLGGFIFARLLVVRFSAQGNPAGITRVKTIQPDSVFAPAQSLLGEDDHASEP